VLRFEVATETSCPFRKAEQTPRQRGFARRRFGLDADGARRPRGPGDGDEERAAYRMHFRSLRTLA
jgi:hypothetical protein